MSVPAWSIAAILSLVVPTSALAEAPAGLGPLDLTRRIVASSGTVGEASAGYVRLSNSGPAADQLMSVACACATRVEFHQIRRSETGVSMDTLPTWDIPAQGALDIRPGSDLHFMLIDFDPALITDGHVALTLTFRDAGAIQTDFSVTTDSRGAWSAFD